MGRLPTFIALWWLVLSMLLSGSSAAVSRVPVAQGGARGGQPTDIAVGSGYLFDGDQIPLPMYSDSTIALESECSWVVAPASQRFQFRTDATDSTMIVCNGGTANCYVVGRRVVANFDNNCGTWPGWASYLIIGLRPADPARPSSFREIVIAETLVDHGETIPRPTYQDGTTASEAECHYIVSHASQRICMYKEATPDPGLLICRTGEAECFEENGTVQATFESDCAFRSGQAIALVVAVRAMGPDQQGATEVCARSGFVHDGDVVPLPVYADGTLAESGETIVLPASASQWIPFSCFPPPPDGDNGRRDCFPDGPRIVANFESICEVGYWSGDAGYLALAGRSISVAPTIELLAPATDVDVIGGEDVDICWSDSDLDSNAMIRLAYDPDTSDEPWLNSNHVWIAEGLAEDPDNADDCWGWSTEGVPLGEYSVWAEISDGLHPSAFSRAPGLVTIWGIVDVSQTSVPRSLSLTCQPNPAPGRTRMTLYLPREDRVDLRIYSVDGRCVRTLLDGRLGPGEFLIKWDGMRNSGEQVDSGMYYYRLATSEQVISGRVVLLR